MFQGTRWNSFRRNDALSQNEEVGKSKMFAAIIKWWRGACRTWCREGRARGCVCWVWKRRSLKKTGLTLWGKAHTVVPCLLWRAHSLWTKNSSLKKSLVVFCQNPQILMFHMLMCSTRIHVCEMRPGMAASHSTNIPANLSRRSTTALQYFVMHSKYFL